MRVIIIENGHYSAKVDSECIPADVAAREARGSTVRVAYRGEGDRFTPLAQLPSVGLTASEVATIEDGTALVEGVPVGEWLETMFCK